MTSLSALRIQALVREMDTSMRKYRNLKTSNPEQYFEKIAEDNKALIEEFPSIFKMHIDGKLDGTFFEMLKLKRKIELGELTEDEASKIVGQKLFDKYVGPVVNNIPPQPTLSYSEFYKQYDNKNA